MLSPELGSACFTLPENERKEGGEVVSLGLSEEIDRLSLPDVADCQYV